MTAPDAVWQILPFRSRGGTQPRRSRELYVAFELTETLVGELLALCDRELREDVDGDALFCAGTHVRTLAEEAGSQGDALGERLEAGAPLLATASAAEAGRVRDTYILRVENLVQRGFTLTAKLRSSGRDAPMRERFDDWAGTRPFLRSDALVAALWHGDDEDVGDLFGELARLAPEEALGALENGIHPLGSDTVRDVLPFVSADDAVALLSADAREVRERALELLPDLGA